MARSYRIRDIVAERTDIQIVGPELIGGWWRGYPSTPLDLAPAGEDWLSSALTLFDVAFGFGRKGGALCLYSTSVADALVAQLATPTWASTSLGELPVREPVPQQMRGQAESSVIVEDLVDWLGITYEQLAKAVGLSRGVLFYWRRPGATPRPSSIRQVQRLHSVVSLLVRRFGVSGAQAWLRSNGEERWRRLLAGDLEWLEQEVRTGLLRQETRLYVSRQVPEDEEEVQLAAPASHAPRRSPRRSTKGRLPDK